MSMHLGFVAYQKYGGSGNPCYFRNNFVKSSSILTLYESPRNHSNVSFKNHDKLTITEQHIIANVQCVCLTVLASILWITGYDCGVMHRNVLMRNQCGTAMS